jgi:hypothetical protein
VNATPPLRGLALGVGIGILDYWLSGNDHASATDHGSLV